MAEDRLVIERTYIKDDVAIDKEVYHGEINMSQVQAEYYKQIIGEGNASITTSRSVAEKSFGAGGDVFVSVTLTCDQSKEGIEGAIWLGKQIVTEKVWEHHAEFRHELQRRGLVK